MKSRDGKSQRREEERRFKRESLRRKKIQVREKVGKSRNTVFFSIIWGSIGSKSRLAKAAGAEPSGQMRDEQLHAVVARSTFPSQNVQNTPFSDHFWTLRCRKSARRCGAKHISKSKVLKTGGLGPLLEVEMSRKCMKVHTVVARSSFRSQNVKNTSSRHFWKFPMSKKCAPLWREVHFEVKMWKAPHAWTTFGRSDVISRGRRKGLWTLSKVSKTWGFCSISKNDGRGLTFEEDLERCIFRRRKETCSSELSGGRALISWEGLHFGAWSDLQVCWDDFAWQVQHFVWPGITFFLVGAVV